MHFIKAIASSLLVASASAASIPWGSCNEAELANIKLPVDNQNATNRLPEPTEGLKLVRVAFGIGTQNYSCTDPDATKPPVQVGALAKLYNANAFACNADQMSEWPRALVQTSPQTQVFIAAALTRYLNEDVFIGDHFFVDATTPTFDFDQTNKNLGILYGKVSTKIPAPAYACKGKAPDNHGAVPWLKIDAKTGYSSVGYQEAYRVNTAGGSPPPTCQGQPASFQVPYTATYYYYN